MAQFRLGILPIEIEIRRYRSLPLENHICKLCNLNQIDCNCVFPQIVA